jgi:hypothetical protein
MFTTLQAPLHHESQRSASVFGARRLSQQSHSFFPEPRKGAHPYIRTPRQLYSPKCLEKKGRSPKFAVASNPSDTVASTLQRHGGAHSSPQRGDSVTFVAPLCIKGLRFVTAQLPRKHPSRRPAQPRCGRACNTDGYAQLRILFDYKHYSGLR